MVDPLLVETVDKKICKAVKKGKKKNLGRIKINRSAETAQSLGSIIYIEKIFLNKAVGINANIENYYGNAFAEEKVKEKPADAFYYRNLVLSAEPYNVYQLIDNSGDH